MKFKTDENLPAEFATFLESAGWSAVSVVDQGLRGSDDPHVAAVCRDEERVLITLDVGFGNIKAYPPQTHAGIIVLRAPRQDKIAVLALAKRLIEAFREREIGRELWIVDERKIRIRS